MSKITPGAYLCIIRPHSATKAQPSLNKPSKLNFNLLLGPNIYAQNNSKSTLWCIFMQN